MRHLRLVQAGSGGQFVGKFPDITFRKKRLTIAIHAQFDMQNSIEVNLVKVLIKDAFVRLSEDGEAKISYTLSDI